MKLQATSLLAGASPLIILAATARGGFNGIEVVTKHGVIGGNPVLTCNVFATFDRPGEDRFLGASGTPGSPMDGISSLIITRDVPTRISAWAIVPPGAGMRMSSFAPNARL